MRNICIPSALRQAGEMTVRQAAGRIWDGGTHCACRGALTAEAETRWSLGSRERSAPWENIATNTARLGVLWPMSGL